MKKIIGLSIALIIVFGIFGISGLGTPQISPAQAEQTTPQLHRNFQADEDDGVLVIAHQGGDGLRPSNTMAAFEHAVELGVDMLEMDVHSTSDGVLVVIHDETVDRTTDGTGLIKEMTYEEVAALDAAYHWPTLREDEGRDFVEQPADEFPYRGQGITIPKLEDVLTAFPDMPMTIEIKQEDPPIGEALCTLLRDHEMTDQVIIPSFSPVAIQDFRTACPEVATAAVESEVQVFFVLNLGSRTDTYEIPETVTAFQIPEYAGSLQVITPAFVENAQALGISIQAWTINTVEDMQRMMEVGVDGIITDYPDRLLELLGRTAPEATPEAE